MTTPLIFIDLVEVTGAHEGHELTFTIGRGNEICVATIMALAKRIVGLELD